MKKLPIFIAAAFGGISPNLLRLAVSLMKEEAELPGITYALGLLIFAVMGGVVAYIWEETDLKKAFYLGIGLPALIQMGAGEISKPPVAAFTEPPSVTEPFAVQESSMQILPVAFMQDQNRDANKRVQLDTKQLTVSLSKRKKEVIVYLYGPREKTMQEERLTFRVREREKTISIPANITSMQVQIGSIKSNKWDFPAKSALTCDVEIIESMWRGLFQAFGFSSTGIIEIKISGKK